MTGLRLACGLWPSSGANHEVTALHLNAGSSECSARTAAQTAAAAITAIRCITFSSNGKSAVRSRQRATPP